MFTASSQGGNALLWYGAGGDKRKFSLCICVLQMSSAEACFEKKDDTNTCYVLVGGAAAKGDERVSCKEAVNRVKQSRERPRCMAKMNNLGDVFGKTEKKKKRSQQECAVFLSGTVLIPPLLRSERQQLVSLTFFSGLFYSPG